MKSEAERSIETRGVACGVCGSSDVEHWARAQKTATLFSAELVGSSRRSVGSIDILRCRRCGLGWQHPLPEGDQLREAYRTLQDTIYASEAENRVCSLRRLLRLLPRAEGSAPGRLLDIGCGMGLFLDLARGEGWDVWGIEPSEDLACQARGKHGSRVLCGFFEDAPLEGKVFEVITLWDVLEHVADPAAFLGRAATLLAPGGVLALNVPCLDSRLARLLRGRWPLVLPEHLHYFSAASLDRLFEAAGLVSTTSRLHYAQFSLAYIAARCAQHRIPGARLAASVLDRGRLGWVSVPLLMGERTLAAKRPP